jgi:hypothetical protein
MMHDPPITFWNENTFRNFTIQNRDLDSMLNDIAEWELVNMNWPSLIYSATRSKEIADFLYTRDFIMLQPGWRIIYHRGIYKDLPFYESND